MSELTPSMSDIKPPKVKGLDFSRVQLEAKLAPDVLSALGSSRDLLAALPVAIYATDAAGRITFYNEAAATMWGCRPELGKSEFCGSWKLYRADGTPMPHDECPMAVTLRERRPVRGVEAVAERPDGTRIPFVPHPTPLFDDAGVLVGGLNMLVDISDAKRAVLSQHLLAAIVESSDDAIVSKNLNGIVTSWNAGAQRLFGYTADEMIGQSILKLIPTDRRSEEDKIIASIRRGERIEHYETVRRRKDGSLVEISLAVSPVRDQEGKIVGASKIARDITERRRAQEQQNLITGEIKHRIRNTLATVQAIAMQTMRTASADERSAFTARLRALADAHDLLTSERWNTALIKDVVSRIIEPFAEKDRQRFSVAGPHMVLNANSALLLTMAIHELATNAVKYGALSNKTGRVAITWEKLAEGPARARLTWRESGGPPVVPPSRKGFGSLLIERTLEDQQGGSRVDYHPQGVVCTLEFLP